MFRNPRRTRAGVSRPGGADFSQGRRRSADRFRASRSWAWQATISQVHRSAAAGSRIAGAVQPRTCLNSLNVCSRSKRRKNACHSKTDQVDARILAQLLAADFLPPVWLPDERTRSLRRQVIRRDHIVRARTRVKNQVHAILCRNLAPTPPVSDLFGVAGRHWLARQDLPADERAAVDALLRQLAFHSGERAAVSKELAIEALTDPVVARLMTIPGADALTAISVVAAVGDFTRSDSPGKLVSYLGLNRKSASPGTRPPRTGTSPRPAAPRSAASWPGQPGQPAARPARCAPPASGSTLAVVTGPRSSPPPGS